MRPAALAADVGEDPRAGEAFPPCACDGGAIVGRRLQLTAYAGILTCAVSVALILVAPWPWLSLAAAIMLACIPPGAGVMCWIDSGEGLAQAGLTLIVSLAAFATASAIMIWLAAWHPRALLALAGAGAVSCLVRLRPVARS